MHIVGIPGRVIHQSGVKINPLAHSALPDAEARVIRNLMNRIDQLENEVRNLKLGINEITMYNEEREISGGESQSLKDREIIEYIGETMGNEENIITEKREES